MQNKTKGKDGLMIHFSGIYDTQLFAQDADLSVLDVRGLSGTNCYCDDEAMQTLRGHLQGYPADGIHFLDSGNYHYMTRLWIEKIREPFRLLVFDNHTDLQPPAFGGILSCGGWIAASLEEVPLLKEVILVGPDEAAFQAVDEEWKKRVRFFSRERLAAEGMPACISWLKETNMDLPFYLSVDKDILSPEALKTNWSQGDLKAEELLQILSAFYENTLKQGSHLLGMDVCGEDDPQHSTDPEKSDEINRSLLRFWRDTNSFQEHLCITNY
ncbi:MAG: arginase family protein [Clostridiales bacterium]|nr:arginase family protein [Candidatus Blautia equi]